MRMFQCRRMYLDRIQKKSCETFSIELLNCSSTLTQDSSGLSIFGRKCFLLLHIISQHYRAHFKVSTDYSEIFFFNCLSNYLIKFSFPQRFQQLMSIHQYHFNFLFGKRSDWKDRKIILIKITFLLNMNGDFALTNLIKTELHVKGTETFVHLEICLESAGWNILNCSMLRLSEIRIHQIFTDADSLRIIF